MNGNANRKSVNKRWTLKQLMVSAMMAVIANAVVWAVPVFVFGYYPHRFVPILTALVLFAVALRVTTRTR